MLLPVVNMIVCVDNKLSYILNSSVAIVSLASLVKSHIAYLSGSFFYHFLYLKLHCLFSISSFFHSSLPFTLLSYISVVCLTIASYVYLSLIYFSSLLLPLFYSFFLVTFA